MRSFLVINLLCSLSLAAAEQSVFGAGDLNNPNPYGLTREEKLILENKQEIQTVLQKSNAQHAKVDTVSERLDGLQTIIEGLVQSSNEQKIALQKLSEADADSNESGTIDEVRQQAAANAQNIEQFKALLEELSHVVDEINANYVTKEQFGALIKQLKVKVPDTAAAGKQPAQMDKAALEKEANRLFKQKKYAEAQALFEQMVQRKYKVAEAYYRIGETYFERNSFKEAVYYYKESASRDDKAGYMPSLLLHSGISMEKTGDTATAKAFYQATSSKFAGTGAAKDAADRLSKLK